MNDVGPLYTQALQHYQAGDCGQAERLCWDILQREPLHAEAIYLLGVLALDVGQPAQALLHFHHATLLQPGHAPFHHALGEAYRVRGSQAEAVKCFHEALRLDPAQAAAHHGLGMALLDQGELDPAVASFRQSLALQPNQPRAHTNLGRALHRQGDLTGAAACFTEAIRLKPDYAIPHNNLGVVRQQEGMDEEAAAYFRKALQLTPHYPEAHCNLGIALLALDRPAQAAASLREAIRLRPEYLKAHVQLGLVLEKQCRLQEAVAVYEAALRLQPDDVETLYNLGGVLRLLQQWEAARTILEKAAALRPDHAETFASLFYVRQMLCDWKTRTADLERLWADAARRLDGDQAPAVPPFFAMINPWPADRLLAVARSHCRAIVRRQAEDRRQLQFTHSHTRTGRLRVGYVSGDFHDHATAHLMRKLFGLHDRHEFEIFAYSFGPDDGSAYRKRIAADCDHFIDVAALTVPELARRIHADGIHLLIDLMGWCGFSRLDVFALRPAPVQASYLVYPGTTGADFIDYLIGDPVVTPPEHAAAYSERLVLLPHAYQVNDDEQPIAATSYSRPACGLPESGFVFCCFNNSYKLEPGIFDVWMRILAQVPDSVLWIYSTSATAESNLRREAEARGIAAERLRFARNLPKAEHLARLRLADLFLDTSVVNAHTTASDALWAGVPLLTCPGQTFATRVAASLLTAIGLPELIVPDLETYERQAVHLAGRREELRQLRAKLAAHRTTWPLFDTPRFVRNLERAYRAMWDLYAAGERPQAIVVTEPGAGSRQG